MQQALRLGRYGLGRTAPNPAVGCVIVNNDQVVGTGYTQPGGRPHAEAIALAVAGEQAKGASAYVSLEPCAHEGQTPPCAQSLINAGVERVIYALDDPDPRVNGGGAAMLRAADVTVEKGLCAEAARRDQLGFLLKTVKQRPMVTLKLAVSANGFMRTPQGESPWITGTLARDKGHMMRAQHDAIITGSGTLQSDDPSLDCRLPGLVDASPVPVVMRRSGALPKTCKLAKRDNVIVTDAAPTDVLADLARSVNGRDMTRVLLECGPTLAAAFLADDLVDAVSLFSAPHNVDMDGESDISRMGLDLSGFMQIEKQRLGVDTYRHYVRKEERL
jgi:diaminohydroxyphosphoribosylaminopyrimidine deaminase/5-amino-6-(5-phosphoribosylamino)uracil reductase